MQEEDLIRRSTITGILTENPEITEAELLAELGIDKLEPEHCLQILEADPHIISVFPIPFEGPDGTEYTQENPYKLPEDFSVDFLGPKAQREIERLLIYLGLSGIQDNLQGVEERRDWKKNTLEPRFPTVYEFLRSNNPVGYNTLEIRIVAPIIFLQEYAVRSGHDKLANTLGDFFDAAVHKEINAFTSSMDELEEKVKARVSEMVGSNVLPPVRVIEMVKDELKERATIEKLVKSMKETVIQVFPIIYKYQKSLEPK